MNVDKNIVLQEGSKYARFCVDVNLSKVIFVNVTIRDRGYKVEYEGLHLLCLNCGKLTHYRGGCGDKATRVAKEGEGAHEGEK